MPPATAGEVPAGLLELIDGWNQLPPGIVALGNGARRNPPAKAAVAGWRRAAVNPEQSPALADIPALLAAIRRARFCHGQPWFTVPWLFGHNAKGEHNVVRLLAGAHDGNGRGNGHTAIGPGQRHAADAAANQAVGAWS